jgi:hypothetical protein
MEKSSWKVWLGSPRQKLVLATVLMMFGLGLVGERHNYDQPHVEVPIAMTSTRVSVVSAGATGRTVYIKGSAHGTSWATGKLTDISAAKSQAAM